MLSSMRFVLFSALSMITFPLIFQAPILNSSFEQIEQRGQDKLAEIEDITPTTHDGSERGQR
jgi:hypothetical protein